MNGKRFRTGTQKRRLRLTICLLLFAFPFLNSYASDNIVIRTTINPEMAWVGQKVILHVDVLAKDGWAQLHKIHNIEIKGAYLLRLESQGTRLNKTIDGEAYSGQRNELLLYAQRDGKITVPSIPVDVEIKTWGAGAASDIRRMSTPPVEFVSRIPPGAEGIPGLISTTHFTAEQTWEPLIKSPQVGNAIKRTIRLEAADVSGMAFTPMQYRDIADLGIYPAEPTVKDAYNRGELTGRRVETVTYVFEQAGKFEIPAMTFPWWDLGSNTLKYEELSGLHLQVGAGTLASVGQTALRRGAWLALIAVVLVSFLIIRYRHDVVAYWQRWQKACAESEAVYFRRVLRALQANDRKAILRHLMRWLDKINTTAQPARLDVFLQRYGDAGMPAYAAQLSGRPDVDEGTDTQAFSRGLRIARRRWRRALREKRRISKVLPELNSTGYAMTNQN